MFNIKDTKVRLTNTKEVSQRLLVGSAYTFYKAEEEDEDFVPTFLQCKLVGKALTTYIKECIEEKEPFIIKSGVIRNEPYYDKKSKKEVDKLMLTIFEIELPVTDEEQPKKNNRRNRR